MKKTSMLYFGHEKAAVEQTQKAILAIINSPAADKVKQMALTALSAVLKIENITISNSSFTNHV